MRQRVVLDTNVFVAAGFHPDSDSAEIVSRIRARALEMVWNDATRRETLHILQKIPPLDGSTFDDLFDERHRYEGRIVLSEYRHVDDADDRKFAALADAAGAALVTMDDDLLKVRDRGGARIVTPREFLRALKNENS